jgi:hypothetical protein
MDNSQVAAYTRRLDHWQRLLDSGEANVDKDTNLPNATNISRTKLKSETKNSLVGTGRAIGTCSNQRERKSLPTFALPLTLRLDV